MKLQETSMRISEPGMVANIEYWKSVADRYRRQRDDAIREVNRLQAILLQATGKAHDGNDYLREIHRSRTTAKGLVRIRSFFRRFL